MLFLQKLIPHPIRNFRHWARPKTGFKPLPVTITREWMSPRSRWRRYELLVKRPVDRNFEVITGSNIRQSAAGLVVVTDNRNAPVKRWIPRKDICGFRIV